LYRIIKTNILSHDVFYLVPTIVIEGSANVASAGIGPFISNMSPGAKITVFAKEKEPILEPAAIYPEPIGTPL
jgi:hypothetical protein